jgi:hypothetical protein
MLNVLGILLSVAIIAAGTFGWNKSAAILGGLVAATVSAQRAFPFGQRLHFYRILIGQSANLITDIDASLATPDHVAASLKSLRLDFAQQLPRGTSFRADAEEDTNKSK